MALIFFDVNETLLTTRPNQKRAIEEHKLFSRLVETLKKHTVVFLSANSLEYLRALLMDHFNLENSSLDFYLLAESSLVAVKPWRLLWKTVPNEEFFEAVKVFERTISNELKYFRLNFECKASYKVSDVKLATEIAEELGFHIFNGSFDVSSPVTFYPYTTSIDLEPTKVYFKGKKKKFNGKAFGVGEFIDMLEPAEVLAFGDSMADLPMLRLVKKLGGKVYSVGRKLRNFKQLEGLKDIVEVLEDQAETN